MCVRALQELLCADRHDLPALDACARGPCKSCHALDAAGRRDFSAPLPPRLASLRSAPPASLLSSKKRMLLPSPSLGTRRSTSEVLLGVSFLNPAGLGQGARAAMMRPGAAGTEEVSARAHRARRRRPLH